MTPVVQQVSVPSVFVSHGSPMVALQAGPYQDALAQFGRSVRPCAIVSISAHWGSGKTISVTSIKRNTTIHDFGGFPAPLYELTYNAPGDPELASDIVGLLQENGFHAATTTNRGLDHGTWIPLRLMYPEADIPVVAMSVPLQLSPKELGTNREEGERRGDMHHLGEEIHGPGEAIAAEPSQHLLCAVCEEHQA